MPRSQLLVVLGVCALGCGSGDGGSDAGADGPDNGAGLIEFLPRGKVFEAQLDVELAGPSGWTLHYTTDGSAPTLSSPEYSAAIGLTATTILRVAGFEGGVARETDSQAYFLADADVAGFSSNLPLVIIDSFGVDIDAKFDVDVDWQRDTVYFAVLDPGSTRTAITSMSAVSGRAGMKVRGNSSRNLPKKQYGLEVWDEIDDDKSVSILGMPKEADWVLHAPHFDRSLMRNHLVYKWSRDIGMYAPRTRFVEVFFNSDNGVIENSDYRGVYVLIEKVERDADRVAVEKMAATDIAEPEVTGGYVLKIDILKSYEESAGTFFRTAQGNPPIDDFGILHAYPKERLIEPAQRAWIRDYLDDFETALYGASFEDNATGYAAYVDEDSFVGYHIIAEGFKNPDSYYASIFMHKQRGELLRMGPVWDYNVSLGGRVVGRDTTRYLLFQHGIRFGLAYWFPRLLRATRYRDAWRARWTSLRASGAPFDIARMRADIDAAETLLAEAAVRHFALAEAQGWFTLGVPFMNFADDIGNGTFVARGDTYAEEVDFLRLWIGQRFDWIDMHLDCLEPTSSEYQANVDCTSIVPF